MDENTGSALAAMALAGIAAGVHSMRLLANRGLVSPAEVEEFADSMLKHFDLPDGDPAQAHLRQLRDKMEIRFAPAFAEIRDFAKQRWIGAKRDQP